MAKPTTISEALQRLEERVGKPATELKVVELQFQWPPIKKMDKTLGTLTICEKLSLSTNMIEKIEALKGLDNLKILSLGRNYIKSLAGLEALADTLEQLWISYNLIEKLGAIDGMKALKVLYIGNNLVKDWDQFQNLASLPKLEDLVFRENPLALKFEGPAYTAEVTKRLPHLKKLDGIPIV